MIEAAVPVAVAIIGAGAALTNRLHGRIQEMDRRLDTFEPVSYTHLTLPTTPYV